MRTENGNNKVIQKVPSHWKKETKRKTWEEIEKRIETEGSTSLELGASDPGCKMTRIE